MKIGTEIEGRYCGISTLFVGADELHELEAIALRQNVKTIKYAFKQIYISDHENIIDLNSVLLSHLSHKYIITIERTEVLEEYPDCVNIILSVESPSFWHLKPNCQVKFSKDMNVFAMTKRQMIETKPSEFLNDITL